MSSVHTLLSHLAFAVSALSLLPLPLGAQEQASEAAPAQEQTQAQTHAPAETRPSVSARPSKSASRTASKKALSQPVAPPPPPPSVAEVATEEAPPAWRSTAAGILVPLGVTGFFARVGMTGAPADILGMALLVLIGSIALFITLGMIQGARQRIADNLRRERAAPSDDASDHKSKSAHRHHGRAHEHGNTRHAQSHAKPVKIEPSIEPKQKIAALERASAAPTPAAMPPPRHGGNQSMPSNFDEARFLRKSRGYFLRLQLAWDKSDIEGIRQFTSQQLFSEIRKQILERGESSNCTDVLSIQTAFLGMKTSGNHFVANVKFTGMIKESMNLGEEAFEEVWSFSKPKDKEGDWVLTTIQQFALA